MFRSNNEIESAKGVTDPPQIRTGRWFSADSHLSGTFKSAKRVDAGRTGQLSSTEIEPSNGKKTFVIDGTLLKTHIIYIRYNVMFCTNNKIPSVIPSDYFFLCNNGEL